VDDGVTPREVAQQTCAPLPAERAFVVQLRAETDPAGELFVGRAEHMASGSAESFTCAAELIEFIARTLTSAAVRTESSSSMTEPDPEKKETRS